VGLGFDLSVAAAYSIDPKWFPNNQELTLEDVLTTAIGTAIGWGVMKAVAPHINPAVGQIASAGLVLLPGGRVPGRMRFR